MIEKLNVTKTIKVPGTTIWDAISGIGHLDRWFPVIKHCQVDGQGVGATRTLTLVDGGVMRDVIVEIDHDKHQFCYKRTESPFPISHYLGSVNVNSTKKGETELSWSVEYQLAKENRHEMRSLILNVIAGGINGIEQDLQK